MLFYVCDPNLVFVSCKSTALRRFTWNNFFLTKTAEHDLSLTSVDFDLAWPRVKSFQRMRTIDARRGTENFKALFKTEFELLTKNHNGGPLAPPSGSGLTQIRSESIPESESESPGNPSTPQPCSLQSVTNADLCKYRQGSTDEQSNGQWDQLI